MTLRLDDARDFAETTGKRLSKAGHDTFDEVADFTERTFAKDSWGRLAGAAAAGFVAGAAVLSARKVAMQATTAMAGDWFVQLKAEHKLAATLFDLIGKTKDNETGKRTALFAKLTYALVKHQFEEENVVYPALRDADPDGAAKHLAAEHFDMKTYLHDLSEMSKDDPRWIKKLGEFKHLVLEHVREEEDKIFPPFHNRLSSEQNVHLTRAMNREGVKLA